MDVMTFSCAMAAASRLAHRSIASMQPPYPSLIAPVRLTAIDWAAKSTGNWKIKYGNIYNDSTEENKETNGNFHSESRIFEW